MKMLLQSKSRLLPKLLVLVFAATQMWACSTSKPKEDKKVEEVQKAQAEVLAEEMGMDVETVKTFQKALAELQKTKPDVAKAEELLVSVLEAEPDFAEAHYNLGVLYSNALRYDEATEHLEKAREIEPEELDHTVALAQAYAVTEKYDKAQTLFEEVVARQPKNLTAKNNLAVLALKAGDDKKAMEYVRDVLREDYENVGALSTLGLINKKRENISLAKFALKEAIKLSKDNPDPDLHNNLGLVYMMEDDVPNAVEQFEKANKAGPNYLESRLNLGAILIEYLAYERASTQFAEAVRIAPQHCVARLGKAAADYGFGSTGNADANKASAENFEYYLDNCKADDLSSHERLAKLYETKLGDPAKAAKHYRKLATLTEDEEKKNFYKAMANTMESQANPQQQKAPEQQAEDETEPAEGEGDEAGTEEGEDVGAEDVDGETTADAEAVESE
ncbi:tetratricopeptide repeat protein [Persicimonas caeni]|nr:tetratricopeptide repeat protein [Persicimonas caeni]